MDQATILSIISTLGPSLYTAFNKLVEKGIIEPALAKGLAPVSKAVTRGYDNAKDKDDLSKAIKNAIDETLDPTLSSEWQEYRWALALASIQNNSKLATKVAAAVLVMTTDNVNLVPPDLMKELRLSKDQRAHFARFLFSLRKELSKIEIYRDTIKYLDQRYSANRLDDIYEAITTLYGAIKSTSPSDALRVQIVTDEANKQEESYLRSVIGEFIGLSLEGRSIDDTIRPDNQIHLDRVYIALNTTDVQVIPPSTPSETEIHFFEPNPTQRIPCSALRTVIDNQLVILLGDAGSGKTTFAEHLCLCLAGSRLNSDSKWPQQLKSGDVEKWPLSFFPLPIFVRLRAFAYDKDVLPTETGITGKADYILAYLKSLFEKMGYSKVYERVLELLETGNVFIVFDGLDEVLHPETGHSDSDRRTLVAQAINHFANVRFPNSRVLVTCRSQLYPLNLRGAAISNWRLPNFKIANLADLEYGQIEEFCYSWFEELYARGRVSEIEAKRDSFLIALASRPELNQLAGKPLLLTQMAIVHTLKKLPDSRSEVYKECAELLLWEWEHLRAQHSGRQENAADSFLKILEVDGLRIGEIEDAIDQAVFQTHLDGEPEIPKFRLRSSLQTMFHELYNIPPDLALGKAEKFINEWLCSRNSLLVPASENAFDLPHRSLREFVTARYLRHHMVINPETQQEEDWKISGPRLVKANINKWREVLRFAAGLASLPEVANALNELCPDQLSHVTSEIMELLLAAEIANDVGGRNISARSNKTGKLVYSRIEGLLINVMRDTVGNYPDDNPLFPPTSADLLSPQFRFEAGSLLDSLGWAPIDLYTFDPVFSEQSESTNQERTDPLFWIGHYPVTIIQYKRFLEASDYNDPSIWKSITGFDANGNKQDLKDDGWNWFQKANKQKRRQPDRWLDPRFGPPRRIFPVVGVSWYESAAYCAWLQRHFRELPEGQISGDFLVRLPTEREWSLAAGGSEYNRFAWDNNSTPTNPTSNIDDDIISYANTNESNLGGTSPVCMYPLGKSPYGSMDMSGNVWEWQANLYDEKLDPYRALRGGAWYCEHQRAYTTSRNHFHPTSGWDGKGFRICLVTTKKNEEESKK